MRWFFWFNYGFGGSSMTDKIQITIHWGTDKEPQDKKTYVFEDETQKAFFMQGVNEANGWLEYEVVENAK